MNSKFRKTALFIFLFIFLNHFLKNICRFVISSSLCLSNLQIFLSQFSKPQFEYTGLIMGSVYVYTHNRFDCFDKQLLLSTWSNTMSLRQGLQSLKKPRELEWGWEGHSMDCLMWKVHGFQSQSLIKAVSSPSKQEKS